jgi:tetratricopeptide (TPR) repeat protein
MNIRTITNLTCLSAVVVIAVTGCSRKSREARYLKSANAYYTARRFDYAAIQYLNVLRMDPNNAYAIQRLGSIYMGKGDLNRAYYLLQRADQLSPNNTDIEQQLGLVLLSAGDRAKARDQALAILKREPANGKALLLLSDCALGSTDVQAAHARFAGLLKTAKDKGPVYLAQGNLYLREGRFTNAATALHEALALDPKLSAVHTALGNLHWVQNNLTNADQEFQKAAELTTDNVAAAELKLGDFRLRAGNLQGATNVLEKLTHDAPEFLPGWAELGDIALSQKNFKQCQDILKRMQGINARDYRVQMFKAQMALAQNHIDEAIRELARLHKDYPSVPRVPYLLARACLANNDLPQALARAKEAVDLNPNYTDAVLLAGELSLRQNDPGSAVTALEALRRRQPQEIRTQLLLANAYQAQKRFPEALAIYQGLVTRFPTNALPHFMMGMAYKAEQRPAQARSAFRRALELAPNSFDALAQLSSLDVRQGNFTTARGLIETQIKRLPKAAMLRFLLAEVQIAQATRLTADHKTTEAKQTQKEAEQSLQLASQLDPNMPAPYLLLAQLYVKSGDYKVALEKCRQVIAKDPKNVAALMDEAVILDQTKDYANAAKTYDRLLGVNPDFAPALNNLAYDYSEHLKENVKALKLAQHARQLLPSDPSVADTLGWVLYKQGEYNRAASLFQESATLLSDQPDVQFHLGLNDYMLARLDEATQAFRRVLELNPKYERRSAIQDCLATLALNPRKADASTVGVLEQRVAKWPGDLVAYLRLGQVEERLGDRGKALAAYQKALALNSKAPPVLVNVARLYSDDPDKLKEAMDMAQTARGLSPNDPTIVALMGHLARRAGNYSWSASLLRQAASQSPADPEVCFDLARAEYGLGKVQEATNQAGKALAMAGFTQAKAAREFLGFLAAVQEERPAAGMQAAVQAALKADPRDLAALMVQALIQRQAGHDAEAAAEYEKVLGLAPAFVPAMKTLVALYAGPLKQEQKALDIAQRMVSAAPNDGTAGKLLGELLYKTGDYRRCTTVLQRTASRSASDPEVFYYLGMAHCRLKEVKAGKKALQSSLALNLQPSLASEARKVLATMQ